MFLRANRVLSVDRHFVQDGANSLWAICVSYLGDAHRPQTANSKEAVRDTLHAVTGFLREHRQLQIKQPVRIGRSAQGVSFCGFRVLPGAILLSRRRRQRYAETRARWERVYSTGQIDARGLQAGYASALGMTAAADARAWRAEQLRRVPLGEALAHV